MCLWFWATCSAIRTVFNYFNIYAECLPLWFDKHTFCVIGVFYLFSIRLKLWWYFRLKTNKLICLLFQPVDVLIILRSNISMMFVTANIYIVATKYGHFNSELGVKCGMLIHETCITFIHTRTHKRLVHNFSLGKIYTNIETTNLKIKERACALNIYLMFLRAIFFSFELCD